MSKLRDFLYLDSGKLYSFVSQLQGGLVDEINQTTKQLGGLSAGINVGILDKGAKVDASRGKESESQQVLQLTDPAYFNTLYKFLEDEKAITDISNRDVEFYDQFDEGDFVEARGMAAPPIVEAWIDQVEQIFGFIERNAKTLSKLPGGKGSGKTSSFSNFQLRESRKILDLLYDFIGLGYLDQGKQFIKISPLNQQITIWAGLVPQFVISPLNNILPANVTVLGRIERVLMEGDVVKIVDLAQFPQASNVDQLLEAINGLSTFMGRNEIHKEDLEASYPAVFVTPIAVYR